MLKVIDSFTTRDGVWEVDTRPYGLTKDKLEKYGGEDIPGKGGASHIFVKVKPKNMVRFYTKDATTPQSEVKIVDASGWVNFNLWKSSAYWPPNVGPWFVDVDGVEVASGLGLPEGLHVSTFLDVDEDNGVAIPDAPTPGRDKIQVIVNGVVVWEQA